MAYVSVDVYIDDIINEIEDETLVEELEQRGYTVSKDSSIFEDSNLTHDEITAILERFQMSLPGTTGYFIYEKLKKK
jgi:hypothetical protein